ncbi:MFS transporter (plasmid) [Streptosporangium sp. NBC_01495]|uniref:MFS transporter n=1 Tax=Streptosporangium sp. NBC_01495 TaxID=2903899 RepID=UPI002E32F446|nr:MFS transporter [Streptosporangium sp. NBC_01495]
MADTIAATLILPVLGDSPLAEGAAAGDLQWMMSAFAVPYAALLASCGRLADALGRRRMLLAGLMLFTAGAAVALAAPVLSVLLGARALQGVGAAAMIPASLSLLLARITPHRRTLAIGIWSAAAGLGGVLMHGGGGWLAAQLGWHALLAPSMIIGVMLILVTLAVPDAPASGRLPDLVSSLLLLAGGAALILAISKGQAWGWRTPATIGTATTAGALLLLTVWRSERHRVPAIDLQLWRRPAFALAGMISLLYGMLSFGLLATAPLLLHQTWSMGLAAVGVALAPISGGVLVTSLAAGPLLRRHGARSVIYTGVLITSAGALWLLAHGLTSQPNLPVWAMASAAIGCGLGAISTGASAAAALSAGATHYASAVGASMTARQVGGALGVAGSVVLLQRPFLSGVLPGHASVIVVLIALSCLIGLLALLIAAPTPPPAPAATRLTVEASATAPGPAPARHREPSGASSREPAAGSAIPAQQRLPLMTMYATAAALVAATDFLLAQSGPASPGTTATSASAAATSHSGAA